MYKQAILTIYYSMLNNQYCTRSRPKSTPGIVVLDCLKTTGNLLWVGAGAVAKCLMFTLVLGEAEYSKCHIIQSARRNSVWDWEKEPN